MDNPTDIILSTCSVSFNVATKRVSPDLPPNQELLIPCEDVVEPEMATDWYFKKYPIGKKIGFNLNQFPELVAYLGVCATTSPNTEEKHIRKVKQNWFISVGSSGLD